MPTIPVPLLYTPVTVICLKYLYRKWYYFHCLYLTLLLAGCHSPRKSVQYYCTSFFISGLCRGPVQFRVCSNNPGDIVRKSTNCSSEIYSVYSRTLSCLHLYNCILRYTYNALHVYSTPCRRLLNDQTVFNQMFSIIPNFDIDQKH